jgi:hypothetical protein
LHPGIWSHLLDEGLGPFRESVGAQPFVHIYWTGRRAGPLIQRIFGAQPFVHLAPAVVTFLSCRLFPAASTQPLTLRLPLIRQLLGVLITATATTTSRTSLYKSFIECNVRDVAVADSWPPRQRTQRHHGTGHNVVSRPFLAWRSTMSVERHSRTLLGMLCAVSTRARPMAWGCWNNISFPQPQAMGRALVNTSSLTTSALPANSGIQHGNDMTVTQGDSGSASPCATLMH